MLLVQHIINIKIINEIFIIPPFFFHTESSESPRYLTQHISVGNSSLSNAQQPWS